jgi:hypothetical protein
LEIGLVGRDVVAVVVGFLLIFQIFTFTAVASNSDITPSSWALSNEAALDPPLAAEADVSIAMKQIKRMTLLSIRNNSELSLYSVEVKNPNGAIEFAKAKGWNRVLLEPSTAKLITDDRPINYDGNLILLILAENFGSSLQWSVYDNLGNVLASGTVHERAKQPASKPTIQEGTEEAVKSQPATNNNSLILKVLDRNSKRPVEDATVIVIDSSGKVRAGKTTDGNGEIKLIVSSGNYRVTIQANSYNKLVETLQVDGDIKKTFELTRTSSVTIRTTAITN